MSLSISCKTGGLEIILSLAITQVGEDIVVGEGALSIISGNWFFMRSTQPLVIEAETWVLSLLLLVMPPDPDFERL